MCKEGFSIATWVHAASCNTKLQHSPTRARSLNGYLRWELRNVGKCTSVTAIESTSIRVGELEYWREIPTERTHRMCYVDRLPIAVSPWIHVYLPEDAAGYLLQAPRTAKPKSACVCLVRLDLVTASYRAPNTTISKSPNRVL
jgi:hypothetical protein